MSILILLFLFVSITSSTNTDDPLTNRTDSYDETSSTNTNTNTTDDPLSRLREDIQSFEMFLSKKYADLNTNTNVLFYGILVGFIIVSSTLLVFTMVSCWKWNKIRRTSRESVRVSTLTNRKVSNCRSYFQQESVIPVEDGVEINNNFQESKY